MAAPGKLQFVYGMCFGFCLIKVTSFGVSVAHKWHRGPNVFILWVRFSLFQEIAGSKLRFTGFSAVLTKLLLLCVCTHDSEDRLVRGGVLSVVAP